MSDNPNHICFPKLEEDLCQRCLRSGWEFLKLEDESYCCVNDITKLDLGIENLYVNSTDCPFVVPSTSSSGFQLGLSSIVPLAIGAFLACGLYIACRYFRRRISRFFARYSTASNERQREDVELRSLFNVNFQEENEERARVAADLLNRKSNDNERAATLARSQRTYGSAPGAPETVITVANPFYDMIKETGVRGQPVSHDQPPLPSRQGGSVRSTYLSRAGNFASRPPPPLHSLSVIDEEEIQEEERILKELRLWGRVGKVRFAKKRNDSNNLSEWETNVYF